MKRAIKGILETEERDMECSVCYIYFTTNQLQLMRSQAKTKQPFLSCSDSSGVERSDQISYLGFCNP